MKKKLTTYQQIDTAGKSQLELVIKIFDGALQSLNAANDAYQSENYQSGYKELEKVRRFVVHLYSTLDFVKGEEVADQLGALYVHLINEIDLIEATKDIQKIDSCTKVLQNLHAGWIGLRPGEMQGHPNERAASYEENSVLVTA